MEYDFGLKRQGRSRDSARKIRNDGFRVSGWLQINAENFAPAAASLSTISGADHTRRSGYEDFPVFPVL